MGKPAGARMYMKRTAGSVVFDILNVALLVLLCVIMLYPFLFVVSRSVMSAVERTQRPFSIIPLQGLDWTGYRYILDRNSRILQGFRVTIFRTVVGTVLTVVVGAMLAYTLSKKRYPLRGFLTVMVAFTLWFNAGLIPRFLVVRAIGLYNSIWVYVLVPLVSAWGVIIMRTFFQQIPDSLEESARLDGANEFVILFRIVFPLSTAVLATMGLFSMVYHWNEWFMGIIYISDQDKVPVQVMLYQTLRRATRTLTGEAIEKVVPPALAVQMALIVVTAFPIVVVYPFFQKYFVKGMLIGSIKG